MAMLIGMSGDVDGRNFEIDRDELTIGRSRENTIVIDDAAVSGKHCAVVRDGLTYMVRDLGSTNGTRLNNRDVQESRLKPKDIIRVGSVEFMFDADQVAGVYEEDDGDNRTEVEIESGPVSAPASFDSISPFGARKPEGGKGLWYVLIGLVGILALIAVALLFVKLMSAS